MRNRSVQHEDISEFEIEALAVAGHEPANGTTVLRRIQFFTLGVQPIRDGRKVKVTLEDAQRVLSAFESQLNDVPILYQHGDDPARGTEAGGWVKRMEVIPDGPKAGLYAYVEYTADARQEIREKKWKYTSASFKYEQDGNGYMRPLYVREISLTNTAAVDGMDEVAASESKDEQENLMAKKPAPPKFESADDDTVQCSECKAPFVGTHADLCSSASMADGASAQTPYNGKQQENTDMDEKALKEFEAKQDAKFNALVENLAAKFNPEAIQTAVFAKVQEAAAKDAEIRLSAARNADKVTNLLDAAEKSGKITTAQRAKFVALVGDSPDPAKVEAYVADLPAVKPLSIDGKTVNVDGTEDDASIDTRNAKLQDAVRYADMTGCTIPEAVEILSAKAN